MLFRTMFFPMHGRLAHRETGKFPGGPLPNYKILKLQISANSFYTKHVTWQCKCKPCFRCYLIPPVGSTKKSHNSLHWLPITGGCHSAAHDRHVKLMIWFMNWSFSVFLLRCCCYKLSQSHVLSTDYCMLMFVHVTGTLFNAVQRSTHLT